MLLSELIEKKRDGNNLTAAEINQIVAAISDGSMGDAQLGAFAMAVYLNGMDDEEGQNLTCAMRDSGTKLVWDVPGPVLDKHSTGGVGDCVSLVLAPMLAVCGAYVPMISGRGLGHTGGTLDKLQALPGYDIAPSPETFKRVLTKLGCAIVGQTDALAPADRRLYAVRDVTGTVASNSLIAASILSKKLAAGLQHLMLDVKTGSGAFMREPAQARELAQMIVRFGKGAGCNVRAVVSDMNQPLAQSAGNALELQSVRAALMGEGEERLVDLCIFLCASLLLQAKICTSQQLAEQAARATLSSGQAAEKFAQMAKAFGAQIDPLTGPLVSAPVIQMVEAPHAGVISQMDVRKLGLAVVELGGGRTAPEQQIDPSVGLANIARLGSWMEAGDPMMFVHAQSEAAAQQAAALIRDSVMIAEVAPREVAPSPALILEEVTG